MVKKIWSVKKGRKAEHTFSPWWLIQNQWSGVCQRLDIIIKQKTNPVHVLTRLGINKLGIIIYSKSLLLRKFGNVISFQTSNLSDVRYRNNDYLLGLLWELNNYKYKNYPRPVQSTFQRNCHFCSCLHYLDVCEHKMHIQWFSLWI